MISDRNFQVTLQLQTVRLKKKKYTGYLSSITRGITSGDAVTDAEEQNLQTLRELNLLKIRCKNYFIP